MNSSANGALCGLKTSASRVTCGAVCLSASSHLVPIENSKLVKPVRLPPGCAKFGTKPWPTGSVTCVNTIGTVPLCSRSAAVTGVLLAKITSGAMARQLRHVVAQYISVAGPAIFDQEIASLNPSQFLHDAFESEHDRCD